MEIGPGTGAVGLELLKRIETYAAIEQSRAMAELMRRRGVPVACIHVADAGQAWPLPAGGFSLVFGSRALHLLEPEHLVDETLRVCGRSAALLVGRVRRQPGSVRERLRELMQGALSDRGVEPRRGRGRDLRRIAERRGGRQIDEREVAEWIEHASIADALDAWRDAPGLAGRNVSDEVKLSVLDEVRKRAESEMGDASAAHPCHRRYVLNGFVWPDRVEMA